MQDRVPTKPNRAFIKPEDGGSAFYATITRADEPTQTGDPLNKATFLKDETAAMFGLDPTATPDDVFKWLAEWGQTNWKLLAKYDTAGAFTFIVPDDVDELGVFILGGGASGMAVDISGVGGKSSYGGASGGLKQVVLKKINGDFASGEEVPGVVGAGGVGGTVSTDGGIAPSQNGGTSSFGGVVSEIGQAGDTTLAYEGQPAPYGLVGTTSDIYRPARENPLGYGGRNIFDPNDTHIYCGAGGFAHAVPANGSISSAIYQSVVTRTKGAAGAGSNKQGGNATAPGDGGGGVVSLGASDGSPITAGNGADGLVLVYGRKVV